MLPKYSVFRMPYKYPDEALATKIFVCICHEATHAICMKATSKVAMYANDAVRKAGVVYYPAGQLDFFPVDTAVQPDNPHPIPHTQIMKSLDEGTFKMLGQMPDGFGQLLAAAIHASITMKPQRKLHFLERL